MFDSDELRKLASNKKWTTVQVSSNELLSLLNECDRMRDALEEIMNGVYAAPERLREIAALALKVPNKSPLSSADRRRLEQVLGVNVTTEKEDDKIFA